MILKTCFETKLAVGYTDNGHRDLIDGEKYEEVCTVGGCLVFCISEHSDTSESRAG